MRPPSSCSLYLSLVIQLRAVSQECRVVVCMDFLVRTHYDCAVSPSAARIGFQRPIMSRVQIPNIARSRLAHADSGKCVAEWTVVPLTFSQLEIRVALHVNLCLAANVPDDCDNVSEATRVVHQLDSTGMDRRT